ncbi:MAG: RDD family protein, partial [Bacteroidota bacterium]
MSVINIETTQNVTIDYQLAGLGSRILAYLIDFLVLFAYTLLVLFLATSIAEYMTSDLFAFFQIGLIALPYVFYDLVCEVFFNGQSVGKRSMGIKVVKIDGSKPGHKKRREAQSDQFERKQT